MNILITSDYHLDENKRIKDFQKSLARIEEYSRTKEFDYYINCGDVFHGNHNPTPLEEKILIEHLNNIRAKHKKIIIGNHDEISENLSRLECLKYRKDIELLKVFIAKVGNFNIYIAHRTVSEAKIGAYQKHLNDISYKDIYKNTKSDIIILGHVHTPQIISKADPLVFCPGSIEKITFDERLDEKCFFSLNINSNNYNLHSIKLDTRKMFQIIYNINENKITLNDKVIKFSLIKSAVKDAIVKLKIIGKKEDIKTINYDKLIENFKDAYQFDLNFEYIASNLKSNFKNVNQSKTDEELIKEYCKQNNIDKNIEKICLKIVK